MRYDDDERFWPKVDKHGPVMPGMNTRCWQWMGGLSSGGYGAFYARQDDGSLRNVGAHRHACEDRHGPLGSLTADHLCRNRRCVNPDHLDPVTQADNNARAEGCPPTINAAKDACPNGHPYSGENLYEHRARDGFVRRRCRECDRERVRLLKARRRKAERDERTLGV